MECQKKFGGKIVSKKQYETNEIAIEVCGRINKNPKQIHKVVPYKCSFCHKFHVGKNGKLLNHEKDIYKS